MSESVVLGPGAGGQGTSYFQGSITESSGILPTPTNLILPVVSNPYSPMEHRVISLASGDNTIEIPAETAVLTILPPLESTVTLKLKGAAGDTGITVTSAGAPIILPFQTTPPTSIILNASAALTGTMFLFN